MDYKYIRAWERIMRGRPYYLEMQLQKARAEGAPKTATYRRNDGTWATFEGIAAESTKKQVADIVAALEKEEDEYLSEAATPPAPRPYERTRAAVYATGNRWAIENFNATHG